MDNKRKKETEKNLFRDKRGSSALVVLSKLQPVFVFRIHISLCFRRAPRSAKNGVSWVSSNFNLLAFLACFSVGTYLVFKLTGNKKHHGNDKGFYHSQSHIICLSLPLSENSVFHYVFSISAPGNWPHFSFSNYVLRKSGSGLSCYAQQQKQSKKDTWEGIFLKCLVTSLKK